jgi:hypothetical protein
VLELGAADEA